MKHWLSQRRIFKLLRGFLIYLAGIIKFELLFYGPLTKVSNHNITFHWTKKNQPVDTARSVAKTQSQAKELEEQVLKHMKEDQARPLLENYGTLGMEGP